MISGKIKVLYSIDFGVYHPSLATNGLVTQEKIIPHIEVDYQVNLIEGIPVVKSKNDVVYNRISSKSEIEYAGTTNEEFFHSVSMVLKYLKSHSFQKSNSIGKTISDKKYSFNIRPKSLHASLTDQYIADNFRWSKRIAVNPVAITCSSKEMEDACKTMNMQLVVSNKAYDATINQLMN